MGLDLTIRKQSNFRTDKKDRTVFTVTVLTNLRNCWYILEKLSDRLENGFDDCAAYSFNEGTFHAILKELKEELSSTVEKDSEDLTEDLEYEIGKLEEFLKENNLVERKPTKEDEEYGTSENYGEVFEVHAWW